MRILVPVDGSADCAAARQVALQVAAVVPDACLDVLHVINVQQASGNLLKDAPHYVGFEPAIVSEEVRQRFERTANELVDGFVAEARARGIKVAGRVCTGSVTEQLVIASNLADAVVMGLRGESNDRFPGQGGAQVANAVPQFAVPALLVPHQVTQIHSMAVGYDGSPAAQRSLKSVRLLAPVLNVPVHLVHVGDEPEVADACLAEGEAALEGLHVTRHHVPMEKNLHRTLVKATRDAGADLLVLGFRGLSTLQGVVFGSAREHLLATDHGIALLIAH